MEFDEQAAIRFIKENAATQLKYDDDEILNVIDIIWDYYEDNGMLEISFDDDDEDDLDADAGALIAHARKMIARDKHSKIIADDVEALVLAELQYESMLDSE